jgi:hypothetical protein
MTNAEHTPDRLSALNQRLPLLAGALSRHSQTSERGPYLLRSDVAACHEAVGEIDLILRELYRLREQLVTENIADHHARMAYTAELLSARTTA